MICPNEPCRAKFDDPPPCRYCRGDVPWYEDDDLRYEDDDLPDDPRDMSDCLIPDSTNGL